MKTFFRFIFFLGSLVIGSNDSTAQISQPKDGQTSHSFNRMLNAIPNFDIPDTVCVGTPVTITNTSSNASNFYWNFCVADLLQPPDGLNMGNGNGNFRMPVFMDYAFENGNYYGFVVNFHTPGLTRLNFGNSLLNTPTYHYLGNFGGIIPSGAEGIQVVKNEGKWYVIIVGGNTILGTTSRVLKVELGTNIANPSPTAHNWGNVGNMWQPVDLHMFKDGNNWYGFTVSAENNTFTRIDFGSSFDNQPTGINFGSVGGLAYPTGIHAINDDGFWRVFVVNGGNNSRVDGNWSLSRLDFGSSLLNTPVGTNLGNPGGFLKHPRDLTIMRSCGQTVGYAVNAAYNADDIAYFDFNGDLSSVPEFSTFGNIGNLSFPHSISKLFREGEDLYAFITSVDNTTMTRLRFKGCDQSNHPPSALENPPPIIYNSPGVYGINLTIDIGLSTQDAICKSVVVVPPLTAQPLQQIEICPGETVKLGAQTVLGTNTWNNGQVGDSLVVTSPGIYWVETDYFGCSNRDSFEVSFKNVAPVNLGNDTTICFGSTLTLDVESSLADSYLWSTGSVDPTINIDQSGEYFVTVSSGGCAVTDTIQVSVEELSFDFTSRQNVCDPLSVEFSHVGNISTNSWWDMGDGNVVQNNTNPTHSFQQQGTYNVRHAVSNGSCSDTVSKTITVSIVSADIIITPDTTICYGSSKQLRTLPALDFCWTPADYLNDPTLANPVTNTTVPIRYYFTAEVKGQNLILNGDFSGGNSGFQSNYLYSPGSGIPEGTYAVGSNIAAWHPNLSNCNDHTGATGNGNMLLVNGSSAEDAVIWSQTVSLQPNTNYAFSAWLQSLGASNPAQLQFSINGINLGLVFSGSSSPCNWQEFYTTWNSGNLSSATIAIVNKNTATNGNDFALDDLSFAPVFIQRDSVNISIDQPLVSAQPVPVSCVGAPVQLQASGAVSYTWDNGSLLDNSALSNPVAIVQDTTRFIVTGINAAGCEAKDTVWVNTFPRPNIQLSSDTSICRNSPVQLWVSGGQSYGWSPAGSLQNPGTANPVASPDIPTTYYVDIADIYSCQYRDSVRVDFIPNPVFTLNSPSGICLNDSIQLQAAGGDSYVWEPAAGISDLQISNPYVSPTSTTQYQVTITESSCGHTETLSTTVTVWPLPEVRASRSADIDCTNDRSQLLATGAMQYSWSPANNLDNPNIANPIARPRENTLYLVKGVDGNGCANMDSVRVNVEKANEGLYWMPSAFTPNGDGKNDCYGINYWGLVETIEFSIFNRWGERVYYSKDPGACWDGRYKGVPQDSGVYVYMIKASSFCNPDIFRKGTVTLVR